MGRMGTRLVVSICIYNRKQAPNMHEDSGPLYVKKYSWLNLYQPTDTISSSHYHYFSEPLPGYQQVSLNRDNSKPLKMYYEIEQFEKPELKVVDDTDIRDFQNFQYGPTKAAEDVVIDRQSLVTDSQWVRKYEPTKFVDLLTDQKLNRDILTWLKSWDPIVFNKNHHQKIDHQVSSVFHRYKPKTGATVSDPNTNVKRMILLAGPPGCGKTTLIRVLANHCKYQVEEINASEDRSANHLIKKLEDIAGNETIRSNQKPTLICLDEVDGAADNQSSGFAKVLDFIQNGKKGADNKAKKNEQTDANKSKSNFKTGFKPNFPNNQYKNNSNYPAKQHASTTLNRPIIFICNDPYAKSLKQLRSKAQVVYFSPLSSEKVIKRLKQILEHEKVYIQLTVLQKITEICKNDIRGCIGILELVAKEKKMSGRSPKEIINRMKVSFTKDNESTISDFMEEILYHSETKKRKESSGTIASGAPGILKQLERQVIQIGNPSLLMQYFLQNVIHVKGLLRKGKASIRIFQDMVRSDYLLRNGYRFNGQLDSFHMIPYANFVLNFEMEEHRKVQFPNGFFERIRKSKQNNETLEKIFSNIPLQLRPYIHRQSFVSPYLLALFLSMQCSTTREDQLNKCVCRMITYNFSFKKDQYKDSKAVPFFTPEIDSLLTFGSRKPEQILTSFSKTLMGENYDFFKERKQLLSGLELKDSTEALLNQMQIQSRKKKRQEDGLKFKFMEGTGTKTSYVLEMGYFFK